MPSDRTSHLVAPVIGDANRRRSFYRSFIQFLFSNLGLILIVVAYSVGGAFLFQLLEQYIELQNCQQGNIRENITISDLAEEIYFETFRNNASSPYKTIEDKLDILKDSIYQRRVQFRYKGQNCTESSDWSILSALLFTITVITSIGYGHVTPTSWEGQITCICYALIGIPIFLLCLANISSVLGDIFRFTYSGLLHCFCCVCRSYTRSHRRQTRRIHAGKASKKHRIDYTGTTSVDPSWPEAYHHMDRKRTDDDNEKENNYDDDDDDREEDDQDDVWNRMESRVPFGVVIIIIIGYIFLGAFIFTRFEAWTMTESVYFCYITLATIGFGDFVPGITSGSTSGFRFLLASIYILFGLAILAMCFDLIKEGIVDKFCWFANKLGILANDEDQIDDDRPRYANFEYDTSNQVQNTGKVDKVAIARAKWNSTSSEPPPYDVGPPDGKWMKNAEEKSGSATGARIKKSIKIKDDKL